MNDFLSKSIHAALPVILKPLIQFLIRNGIAFREFSAICQRLFVDVASQELDARGRQYNLSRIAARTGLSRKTVRQIRDLKKKILEGDDGQRNDLNPLTVVLHYWHTDPDFIDSFGKPRPLKFSGKDASFSLLVRRYAGDIPPGAIRAELKVAGAVTEDGGGLLRPVRKFLTPKRLDERFIRSLAFSWSNLGQTLVNNAAFYDSTIAPDRPADGYLERYVWTDRLTDEGVQEFKRISEVKAGELLAELDSWIGAKEIHRETRRRGAKTGDPSKASACGVGVYYFERR